MAQTNNVPVIVQQMVEAMHDKSNSQNSRHNYMITVENIRNFCDRALREYEKKNKGKV